MNDDPWDPSVIYNALATRERGDVERANSARFYNFAWEYMVAFSNDHRGKRREIDGTLYYNGNGNIFDQIYANRPLLDSKADSGFKVIDKTAKPILFPEMVSHEVRRGPIRFGLPKGSARRNVNEDGYSDHFPIGVSLESLP